MIVRCWNWEEKGLGVEGRRRKSAAGVVWSFVIFDRREPRQMPGNTKLKRQVVLDRIQFEHHLLSSIENDLHMNEYNDGYLSAVIERLHWDRRLYTYKYKLLM